MHRGVHVTEGSRAGGGQISSNLVEAALTHACGGLVVVVAQDPCYVNFVKTELPPPPPTGKKGKKGKGGGGKKGKKEKIVPPPPFTIGFDEATSRLNGKGGGYIEEAIKNLAKKYEEEKKAAEKLAAEKKKAQAAAEKEAKAKEAKGAKKK